MESQTKIVLKQQGQLMATYLGLMGNFDTYGWFFPRRDIIFEDSSSNQFRYYKQSHTLSIQIIYRSAFAFILYFIPMQADYKILPKRNGRSDGSFSKLYPIKFFTNYYDISIDSNKSKIYQYSFALPPEIPQDSELYQKAIYSIKKSLRQKIGYLAHSGQMIWGSVALKVPTTFDCKFQFDSNKYAFESVVKMTKQLDLRDLDQEKTRPIYLQILNIDLKNTLKSLKLCQLGKRGQYFQREIAGSQQLQQKGLQVLKGFRFTLTALNSGIYLQVDVCSRVLQSRNLLEIFNGKPIDFNKQKFEGETVISKYGTFRTYKIQQIDYKLSPESKFYNEKKGLQMTYMEYYRDVYGIKIRNNKQPLLKSIKSVKKQIAKGGKKIEEIQQVVYLIPELVSPTGMTDEQRQDFTTMKILAPFTKLTPNQRVKQCAQVIYKINQVRGLINIKNPKRLQGYCLPKPDLIYSGATIKPDNGGNIKHRGVLKEAFYFSDWLFVYSCRKGNFDDEQADNTVNLLKRSGESYGIKFKNPGFITINSGNIQEWKSQISKDVKNNGAPQIIVLFFSPYEQKFYGELKRFITNQIQTSSQVIRRRTLGDPKRAMSSASKIVIQMNVKVGATPWQVKKGHSYFNGKSVMYGALSISKGRQGYTLAFVGTINSDCTKVFSDCQVGIKNKQNIPLEILEQIFINWAKSYFKSNKKVPDVIMLYREGLSVPQIKMQLPKMEIPALENTARKIGEKTGQKNYNPEIMIITVNKKINSRYFSIGQENRQNPHKFIPPLFNPDSGSVMVQAMSADDAYDFHLAAQYVTQGTCTPTLFRVAYDTTKMPQQALINFTFEQCFNYYNWEGAVRVPACLQCADKLSKLVGQYIKQGVVQSAITKKHFFL